MRVLLDESLPHELRTEITGHDVHVVRDFGWSGLKNGELLKRSAGRIDVFLTADQNLQYQQNLRNLPVAVIVLIAKTNRIQDVRPLIPRLLEELAKLAPQTLVRIAR
jgi:hypothetical protein